MKVSFHFGHSLETPNSLFQITISHYISTFNESINDKYPSLIKEPNPSDRSDKWKSLLSLNITPQSLMKPYHAPTKPYIVGDYDLTFFKVKTIVDDYDFKLKVKIIGH